MNCAQCGAHNAGDDKFCIQCGAPLQRGAPPTVKPRSLRWVPLVLLVGLVFLGGLGLLASKLLPLLRARPSVSGVTATPSPTSTRSAADYANPWPSSEAIPTSTPAAPSTSTATSTPEPGPSAPEADTPTPAAPDTEAQLDEYYHLINAKILNRAYALRTQRSRSKTSQAEFEKIWSNNRSISMEDFQVLSQSPDRATVSIRLRAEDVDGNSGKATVTMYRGKVTLVLEEGLWRYDGGDFQAEAPP